MTTRWTGIALLICFATAIHAENNNNNNNGTVTKHVIHTLPMVRAGDLPPNVKPIPGHRGTLAPKPPQADPFEWIPAPDSETDARQWALASGTNVTATLVKFNKYAVMVRDENDKTLRFDRPALAPASETVLAGFQKQHEADVLKAWQEKQAEKKEKEQAPR